MDLNFETCQDKFNRAFAQQFSAEFDLKRFFQESPKYFDYTLPFNNIIKDDIHHILCFQMAGRERALFSKILLDKQQSTTTGKPCGYMFKKGDGIYHCTNCGIDETCVMCVTCFKATNHDGHDTG
jgi:hypothetical protein